MNLHKLILLPKFVGAAAIASLIALSAATAQDEGGQDAGDPADRPLIAPAAPAPEDGRYLAGENLEFWIDNRGEDVRLRFAASEEVFYLQSEPSSLGGRVLKYDTGEVALAVTGWGGVTLYTDTVPNGIPAELMGEAPNLDPKPVTARETQIIAATLSQRLENEQDLEVGFAANWDRVSRGNRARTLAVDSMRNASYALAELSATPESKSASAARIRVIRVVAAEAPSVSVENDTVTVSFDADGEEWERPSSRAILEAIEAAR